MSEDVVVGWRRTVVIPLTVCAAGLTALGILIVAASRSGPAIAIGAADIAAFALSGVTLGRRAASPAALVLGEKGVEILPGGRRNRFIAWSAVRAIVVEMHSPALLQPRAVKVFVREEAARGVARRGVVSLPLFMLEPSSLWVPRIRSVLPSGIDVSETPTY